VELEKLRKDQKKAVPSLGSRRVNAFFQFMQYLSHHYVQRVRLTGYYPLRYVRAEGIQKDTKDDKSGDCVESDRGLF
jgi:hypothetical protein